MRTMRLTRILFLLVPVALIAALSTRIHGAPSSPEIAVVVNSANPVSAISLADLRKIYMGERVYWKSNSAIVLLMRSSGSPEREVILRVVYQMSEQQYTHYWIAKVMRAEASDPPVALYSHGMVFEGVKGNPGAIGYVDAHDVRAGMKVLRIEGLLPGDPGYPLH